MPLITGNTYPVRVELRGLGGTWNKAMQGWDVPEDKAEEARAIVAAAPAQERRSHSRPRSCPSRRTRCAACPPGPRHSGGEPETLNPAERATPRSALRVPRLTYAQIHLHLRL